jgi:hypothetical protein
MKHFRNYRKTTQSKWLVGPLAVGLTLGAAGVLCAQPDPNNQPMGDNPPAPQGGNRPNSRNMTSDQRKQWEEQTQQRNQMMREQGVRAVLNQYGFGDKALQDAVVAYVKAQDLASAPLGEDSRKLQGAMVGDVGDDQITALLTAWRADIEAERKRRETALAELDTKIHFTKNPRLEALLTMRGFIGEENGFSTNGMMGGRGQGGMNFGRGQGGMNGGRGGRGGQGNFGGQGGQGGPPAGGNGDNPPPAGAPEGGPPPMEAPPVNQ